MFNAEAITIGTSAVLDTGVKQVETPEVFRPVTLISRGEPARKVQKLIDFIERAGQESCEGVMMCRHSRRKAEWVDELLEQAQTKELLARREELQQSNEVMGERAKFPAKQRKDKTAKTAV